MALLNLACRVVVLLMIAAVPGKIIAMPSNSDVHNHDSAFGLRCDISLSKQHLCPNLQSNCCCRKKHKSNTQFSTTEHPTISYSEQELDTLCTSISEFPAIFPLQTRAVILFNSNMVNLTSSALNKTQLSLISLFELSEDSSVTSIGKQTFTGLHQLRDLYFEFVENLVYISESAFFNLPKLRTITLKGTGIKEIQGFRDLGNIDGTPITLNIFRNPKLVKIQQQAFTDLNKRVKKIAIKRNPILSVVEDYAFNGSFIEQLVLNNNSKLSDFSPKAFAGIEDLVHLAFNDTPVLRLPTDGLQRLTLLHAHNVPNMLRFPKLQSLRKAILTYPYHCCALMDNYGFGTLFENDKLDDRVAVRCDTGEPFGELEDGMWITTDELNNSSENSYWDDNTELSNETKRFVHSGNFEGSSSTPYRDENFPPVFEDGSSYYSQNSSNKLELLPDYGVANFSSSNESFSTNNVATKKMIPQAEAEPICYIDANGNIRNYIHTTKMQCSPKSDKFNPCEDLLGSNVIAVISWFVAWFAVLGNFFVVFALLLLAFDYGRTHQRHLTVPKFLILNLAFADFCMGIYILALTVMDNKSKGNYYKYGVEWQTQGGCDVVGFLSIFASQLSIYTLSVISLERWYAIRYAIQLDKRMTLKSGQTVMLIGWLISIALASLPLLGINNYRKTAICLPMDVENSSGRAYVAVLLSLNIIAFLVVCGSYLWMFAIVKTTNSAGRTTFCEFFRVKQARSRDDSRKRSNKRDGCYGALNKQSADTRIAKRMAVLVFTDFACFFPISFFSLFAMGGYPLLSISTAKFLLVFCYPLNACTNPFLYSIMTKSFRKDVSFLIKSLKRLICSHGDDRQRASTKRMKRKQREKGDRQQNRRKTLHVCLDAELENLQPDGSTSVELKSSISTKSTYLKLNTNSSFGNSRCNSESKSNKPSIVESSLKKSKKERQLYCRVINSSVSSSVTSEDNNLERHSLTVFFSRILRIFKRSQTSPRTTRSQSSTQPSFETNITAATATSNACDSKSEPEQE